MGRQALIVKMSGVWICVSGESAHFAFQGLLRLFVFSCFRVFVFSLDVICGWAVQRVFTKKCFRRSVRQTETASLRLCRDNICTAVLAVATADKPKSVGAKSEVPHEVAGEAPPPVASRLVLRRALDAPGRDRPDPDAFGHAPSRAPRVRYRCAPYSPAFLLLYRAAEAGQRDDTKFHQAVGTA